MLRRGRGKHKGAQFEREVCVMLSRWLTNNVQMDVFWRSAMSGGRATVASNRDGRLLSNQVGDLSCINPVGHHFISTFAVECKFYQDLNLKGLFSDESPGRMIEFWKEIKKQAETHNKLPFMVARQNHMQILICVDIEGRRKLGLKYRDMLVINIPNNLHIITGNKFVQVCKPYKRERRRLE